MSMLKLYGMIQVFLDEVPSQITSATSQAFKLLKFICIFAGAVVAIIGGIQLGTSMASQDPSSRQKAIFVILGGVLIAAAPYIVQLLIPEAF